MLTDIYFAKKENILLKNIISIISFRHCQFIGAYMGFNTKYIDSNLKRQFYYPNKIEGEQKYIPVIEITNKLRNKMRFLFKSNKYNK